MMNQNLIVIEHCCQISEIFLKSAPAQPESARSTSRGLNEEKNKIKSAQKFKRISVSEKQGGRRQEVGNRKFQNEVKNDRMNNLEGENIKEKKALIIIKDEERYSKRRLKKYRINE